jgi:hypothetical protein
VRWQCTHTLTEHELRKQRKDFWDTAPMFDGQPDMWLALHAACTHAECGEWPMAQAIVDGAGLVCVDGRSMIDAHVR